MAPGQLNALAAQLHPLPQAKALGHRFDGLGFAPDGIHQGELRLGEGNRHGQAREAAARAHINAAQWGLGVLLQLGHQGPKAVEDLGDPEVIALHQARQVDPAIPVAQDVLELDEALQLLVAGSPVQGLP